MKNHERITNELIGLIYETAKEPNIWPILLGGLSSAMGDKQQQVGYDADNVYQLAAGDNQQLIATQQSAKEYQILHDQLAEDLIPHFQRALEINKQLSEVTTERNSAASVLEHLPLGVIIVKQGGEIASLNPQAQHIINTNQSLTINNNVLSAYKKEDTDELYRLIKEITENEDNVTSKTFSLRDPLSQTSLSVLLTPANSNEVSDINHKLCSLLIATSEAQQAISNEILISTYGLSKAEARLTQYLIKGKQLKEITDEIHISQHTARTQLKAIFQKTDTHRQAELIGKLLTDPNILLSRNQHLHDSEIKEHEAYRFHPKNENESFIQLKDGRHLYYNEYGDPEGKPLMFCHSMISCRMQSPPEPEKLLQLGIRLIVPDRPGYGKSTHLPERTLLHWADDVEELLDHLKLDKFYLIGYSAGGPHAAAIAYRFPERCIRLGLISSIWPFENISDLNEMKSGVKMILALARHAPSLLTPFLSIMAKSALKNPSDYLKRLTVDWSPYDLELIDNKNIMNEMTDCFKEVIRNGTDGFFHEHMLLAKKWGFTIDDIKTEMITWHGEEDSIVPLAYVQRHSQALNNQLISYPNAGHLMIVNKWEEIFSRLIQ